MTNNDADKRPRVSSHIKNKHGEIGFTIQGAEGEEVEDVMDKASDHLNNLIEAQNSLSEEEYDGKEHQ